MAESPCINPLDVGASYLTCRAVLASRTDLGLNPLNIGASYLGGWAQEKKDRVLES